MNHDAWPPCIVTAFDVIGIRNKASTGYASSLMLQIHRFTVGKINSDLPSHANGYVWNDSILLLSYLTKPSSKRRAVLAELSDFKRALDTTCAVETYAISVMGLAFPHAKMAAPVSQGNTSAQPRAVVLKTSSWAMANCFHIEKELSKYRADWYIDSRITKNIGLPAPFASEELVLLPKDQPRTINMYKGYFPAEG